MKAFSKYFDMKFLWLDSGSIYDALQVLNSFYKNIYLLSKNCSKRYVFSFFFKLKLVKDGVLSKFSGSEFHS